MNENEMTAQEIVVYFLKTGELPEKLNIIKVPTEKVTVLKNGIYGIEISDYMNILSKSDSINQWKKLNPDQQNAIISNIPNANIQLAYISLIYSFYFPYEYINSFKSKDAQKAVFVDHNPESIYLMKQVAQFYVHLLDTENKNNITPKEKADSYKRIMTYLWSQKDFLGDNPTSIYFMKQIALFHVNLLDTENKNNFPQKDDYYKRRMTYLRSEKKFLVDLLKMIDEIPQQSEKPKPEQFNENTLLVIEKLNQYRFLNFLRDNSYEENKINQLIHKHSGTELMPYTIALLSEINFLDYFFKNFTKNKTDGFKKLGKIFDANVRRIRGNVNILNPYSSEDPTQYTSRNYIEIAKKELKGTTIGTTIRTIRP